MSRLMSAALLFLGVLTQFQRARAATIVSTFGPGESYLVDGGLSISTLASANDYETAAAVSFDPSSTFTLQQIDLALGWVSGTNSFDVSLRNDNNGPTGSVIETWTLAAPSFSGPDLDTLSAANNVVLDAGSTYWITVLPGGSNTWGAWNTSPNDTATVGLAESLNGGSSWYPSVSASGPGVPAFDVISTPEPGSLPVLLASVRLAIIVRRSRSSASSRRSGPQDGSGV
jgi:hypothetical protein